MTLFSVIPIVSSILLSFAGGMEVSQWVISLEETSWHLVSWREGDQTQRPLWAPPIVLMFKGGNVNGFGGCNSFFSSYQRDGDRLTMTSPFSRTFKACARLLEQEDDYLSRLGQVQRYEITAEGEMNLFYSRDGELGVMHFRPDQKEVQPPPSSPDFSDVPSTYWAKDFIDALVLQGLISGFPDGTFRPESPVTRAQFATLLQQSFDLPQARKIVRFEDVASDFWAYGAIQYVATTIPQLMNGYPDDRFYPQEPILRVQVVVALGNLLREATADDIAQTLSFYEDAAEIPEYALERVAIATQQQMVINYPHANQLKPNQVATKAEVAALIYQALKITTEEIEGRSPSVINP